MKRIVLLFTVAAMMALMSLAMGAGPALAQTDDDDFNVFSIFDDPEPVVIEDPCDGEEGETDRVGDTVVIYCDDEDEDEDDFCDDEFDFFGHDDDDDFCDDDDDDDDDDDHDGFGFFGHDDDDGFDSFGHGRFRH